MAKRQKKKKSPRRSPSAEPGRPDGGAGLSDKRHYKPGRPLDNWVSNAPAPQPASLRVIGGTHRGRQLKYSGDPLTRPMKDNTREALFNLVGGWIPDKIAFDLFAGTGAVGIEALSRGAEAAIFIERHFPSAKLIQTNLDTLELAEQGLVQTASSFFWSRQFLQAMGRLSPGSPPAMQSSTAVAAGQIPANFLELAGRLPWAVFFCPPYALYRDQRQELLEVIAAFLDNAPADSLVIVEADEQFDCDLLPEPGPEASIRCLPDDEAGLPSSAAARPHWRVRSYPPAQIAIWR